jgi:hypothetical protein
MGTAPKASASRLSRARNAIRSVSCISSPYFKFCVPWQDRESVPLTQPSSTFKRCRTNLQDQHDFGQQIAQLYRRIHISGIVQLFPSNLSRISCQNWPVFPPNLYDLSPDIMWHFSARVTISRQNHAFSRRNFS